MDFDLRIVKVTFDDGNQIDVFENLAITIVGQRTLSFITNQATVNIANLDETTRTRIATKFSSPNLFRNAGQRAVVTIEIGRQSFGTFVLFKGEVTTVTISDPPDIVLSINLISKYFDKTIIESRNFGITSSLFAISQNVADQLQLSLDFKATDKNVQNVYFEGDALKQIKLLSQIGNVQVTIDNDSLLVLDNNRAINDNSVLIDVNNGLIGVPNFKEYGIQFKVLASPLITLGTKVRLNSIINPAVNDSQFKIVNLLFNITNRDTPFYYDLFGIRIN